MSGQGPPGTAIPGRDDGLPGFAAWVPHPLAAFARTRPDHLALRVRGAAGVTGPLWTARRLEREVARVAAVLAGAGASPGARIALLGAPSAAWVRVFYGIGWLGACARPLDPALAGDELRRRLVGVDLVVFGDGLGDRSFDLPAVPHLRLGSAELADGSPGSAADPLEERPWPLGEARVELFTSGSTGAPQRITLCTANLLFGAVGGAIHLGHHLGDVWHACLPPWHIGGLAILLRTLWCQTTLDLGLGFYPAAISAAIDRGAITQLSLVPAMLRRLVEVRGGRRFPATLRWILVGGAAADEAELAAAEALGATICPTWGMTESAAQVATRSPAAPRRADRVGPPLPFVRVREAAAESAEASAFDTNLGAADPTIHRLSLEGPTIATPSGVYHTQDLGFVDPMGSIAIHGRADRLVISGGRNIDPVAVERVLLRHPAIAQAVVFGIPDAGLGEVLVAVVVAAEAASPEVLRALDGFVRQGLHPYDRPRRWGRVPAIPTTAAGKISAATRDGLRRRLLGRLAAVGPAEEGQGERRRPGGDRMVILDLGSEEDAAAAATAPQGRIIAGSKRS